MKLLKVLMMALALTFVAVPQVLAEPGEAEQTLQVVNINQASAQELAKTLDGIGLKKAEAIVNYRSNHGPFKSIEQLAEVKGVGVATIAKNHQKIEL